MKYCFYGNKPIFHFFSEKNWGRNKKMDKNKCPFFYFGKENHFSKNVIFGFKA